MAVRVALVKDNIHKDGKLIPRVIQRNKVDFDTLLGYIDKMTGLSENDIRSVLLQLAEALAFYLPDGSEVQTPIGAFALSAHCRAFEEDALLLPRDRKISTGDMRVRLRTDRGLLGRIRLRASINVVEAPALLLPSVTRVENTDLAGIVDAGSPGQMLHIIGIRLSFNKEDQEQGVFFVGASAAAERIAIYSRNGTNIVDGRVPDLQVGQYRLEVRTRPTGKDIRIGSYKSLITIS